MSIPMKNITLQEVKQVIKSQICLKKALGFDLLTGTFSKKCQSKVLEQLPKYPTRDIFHVNEKLHK